MINKALLLASLHRIKWATGGAVNLVKVGTCLLPNQCNGIEAVTMAVVDGFSQGLHTPLQIQGEKPPPGRLLMMQARLLIISTEPQRGQVVCDIWCAHHELNVRGVEAGDSHNEPEPASPTSSLLSGGSRGGGKVPNETDPTPDAAGRCAMNICPVRDGTTLCGVSEIRQGDARRCSIPSRRTS